MLAPLPPKAKLWALCGRSTASPSEGGSMAPALHKLLFLTLSLVLLEPVLAQAAGVQVLFNLENPSGGPFPSDLFTVADSSHNTGLRVNLPFPDCAVRPSDCDDLGIINTLDGFNVQPRLSIPFSGPIDVSTVTSDTIFLIYLGSTVPDGTFGGKVVGINQVVWDPETNTLHVESDELLKQHSRYAVIVTQEVRDPSGNRLGDQAFEQFRKQLKKQHDLRWYHDAVKEALAWAKFVGVKQNDVAAVSVFTTQSVTAVLEKIRDQLKASTPEPADFLLGSGGTRTVFLPSNVTGITFNRQISTAPTFSASPVPLGFLGIFPDAVGQLAFGKFLSPDYEAAAKFIPPIGTRSGTPAVQGMNEIFFTLYLPSSPKPPNGWPVALFGHGFTSSKDESSFVAEMMAARGIATIAINVVGHGGGPFSTLTIDQTVGDPATLLAGGRGIDQNGDGTIGFSEGLNAAPPRGIISQRDGLRQTVVDLMQLVRVIEVGIDVNGDGTSDLNPAQVYYFGISLGGTYGTLFLAVEPSVRTGTPIVPGGPAIEIARLTPFFRPLVGGFILAVRVPRLDNLPPTVTPAGMIFNFDENMPLRDQPPVTNTVPGAFEIQHLFENYEWVIGAGSPVTYAAHLRKQPLDGMPAKSVIIQFAKGDKSVPNPTTTAIVRAGDLADRATFYRHDLAFHDLVRNPTGAEVPKNPHSFPYFPISFVESPFFFPTMADVGLGAQQQVAEFFASDGMTVIDPDGPGPLFEVPIVGPLPEELNFIP